jgi:hypothetical protein
MASIISAGTTSGTALNMAGDTSGVLELATNGSTTAITIDASQNVGIGTASPQTSLDVRTASGQAIITVVGGTDRGNVNFSTGAADGNGVATGALDFRGGASTSASLEPRVALIGATTEGATANHRGGRITFNTKANNVASLTERMRIDSSGNVLINTTTANGTLTVNGGVSADDFVVGRSSGGNLHVASRLMFDRTTANAANLFVNGSGSSYIIQRNTSSLKYKTDINDSTHGLDDVMKLRSVTYKGINDGEIIFGGLIAEEVHDAGLTEFVQYDEEGKPDALAYGQMVSLAFKAIQEQQIIINDLKARITALEGAA